MEDVLMFFLDTSLKNWYAKHPELPRDDDSFCDCDDPQLVPFKIKGSDGVVCKKCNTGTWIKNPENSLRLINLLCEAPND